MNPDVAVCAAFGVEGVPRLLAGGEGNSFEIADLVLKRVNDVGEAEWTQQLLERVEQRGFRVAAPVRTADGGWVHDNWIAHTYIPDLRHAAPDWELVIAAGLQFCDAAERVRDGGEVLSRRTHRWAVADRVAWGDDHVELQEPAAELLREIGACLHDADGVTQFVHGDLSGNVFVNASGVPVILDVSPYVRPREWAAAIVVVDAVLWSDADRRLVSSFASSDARRDLVLRALVFRLVADQLSGDTQSAELLTRYRAMLREMASSSS